MGVNIKSLILSKKYTDETVKNNKTPIIQSDWSENNTNSDAYIKNKPTSLPASDVYDWAKEESKPIYEKSEIGLNNVDNTSDKDKPVSDLQQEALDAYNRQLIDYTNQTVSTIVENLVSGVKGSEETDYHTGLVSISAQNTGALPITGGEMEGNIVLPNTASIIQKVGENANYVQICSWDKAGISDSEAVKRRPQIGYYAPKGDGEGAIAIVPQRTTLNPWEKNVGLYLNHSEIKFNGKNIITETGGEVIGAFTPSGGITYAGKDRYIAYPSDGSFLTDQSIYTGHITIILPVSWTSTMLKFTVSIYDYATHESVDYIVSGYNYSESDSWYNATAICIGKYGASHSNLTVRFGHNGTKCVVLIGENTTVWQYPQIVVHDIHLGYRNYAYSMWKSGWLVTIDQTNPTVTQTIMNTHVANGVPAETANYLKYTFSNEINFKGNPASMAFNYRNAETGASSGNTAITGYSFCNRNGGTTGVTLYADALSTNNSTYGKSEISCSGEFRIISTGNPGILSDGGLYVLKYNAGSYSPVYASTFSQQSTKSSKENFSSITDEEALNLLKIPPQHFDYINGEKNQSGFIAEDVEEFFPEICSYQTDSDTGEKKLFGLDYSKFSPYIVKLLQVLHGKVSALEQENSELLGRVERLERLVVQK